MHNTHPSNTIGMYGLSGQKEEWCSLCIVNILCQIQPTSIVGEASNHVTCKA